MISPAIFPESKMGLFILAECTMIECLADYMVFKRSNILRRGYPCQSITASFAAVFHPKPVIHDSIADSSLPDVLVYDAAGRSVEQPVRKLNGILSLTSFPRTVNFR